MAQPGNFTPILLYGSSTPTNVPLAANLTNSATGSEIAINVADKNLFFKDSGGAVNTVPIRQSSTSSNGWLSNTDWNTFNSKAPATSGTSILYGNGTGGFSNVTIGSGISFSGGTLSATGSGGTVTSVAALTIGTTGTDLSSTVANGTTTPVITLQVPTASASNRGALSSTDWSTFNNKLSGSGPTLNAYGGSQSLSSGAHNLLVVNTEIYDTNNCFNNTGSSVTLNGLTAPAYSFTPNVAGYYFVTGNLQISGTLTGYNNLELYKNGSMITNGQLGSSNGSLGLGISFPQFSGNFVVYLNGTGDYVQLYSFASNAQTTASFSFQAYLIRN